MVNTPGHLPAEHLDPMLQSFATTGQQNANGAGKLCGNITAGSLAKVPLPAAVLQNCNQYTMNNTMLDLIVLALRTDSTRVATTNVKTNLEYTVAAYGVGFLPINEKFDLLARVGYGTTKLEAKAAGVKVSDRDESWNYGVGAQYSFDGLNGVRGDYTRHDFGNGGNDADVWSVSYVRKF